MPKSAISLEEASSSDVAAPKKSSSPEWCVPLAWCVLLACGCIVGGAVGRVVASVIGSVVVLLVLDGVDVLVRVVVVDVGVVDVVGRSCCW